MNAQEESASEDFISHDESEPITNCTNVKFPNSTLCMVNPEEMLKPWIINSMFFDIVITYSVTFLIGLLGNVTVVVVMIRDRKARSATNLFLVSLAIADLLLLLVYAPLETLQYFVMQWDEDGSICKLAKYAEFLSAIASVLNLAAVTLERFIVIVFPMKSRSVCTLNNCRRGIVLVWFIALILSVPVLFTKVTYPMTFTNNVTTVTLYYCNDERTNGTIFAVYQLITVFVAPGILMLVCYTYVIRELWRSTRSMRLLTNNIKAGSGIGFRFGRSSQIAEDVTQWPCQDTELRSPNTEGMELVAASTVPNVPNEASRQCSNYNTRASQFKGYDARRARKQVIKMLILVVILFLICWGSRIIMELMIKVGLNSYSPSIYRLRVALFVLPVVHSCINPFIYSFMSKNFRRSLQRQLTRLLCCTGGPEARNRTDCTLSRMRTCGGIGVSNSSRTGTRHAKPAPSSFSSTYCATENTKHTEVEGIVLLTSPTSPMHASNHV